MDTTPRFALPYLAPGQAQKEFFHNEALQRADLLLCPVVEELPRVAPPASPAIGQAYIVDSGATGAWVGHDGELAGFGEGGWRFIAATEGMSVIERASGELLLRRSGAWEPGVVRAREVRINALKVVGAPGGDRDPGRRSDRRRRKPHDDRRDPDGVARPWADCAMT